MNIVIGRGNNRSVFEMPCAEIVKRSPDAEQVQAREILCSMLSIPVGKTDREKVDG